MPFDRLMHALDEWAKVQTDKVHILAQIGTTSLKPLHMDAVASLTPSAFREAIRDAKIIVAHAGMGSVLTALEFGKPLVVMPRLGARQETRNDHQVATANWLSSKPGIYVAMSESDLADAIDRARAQTLAATEISPFATPELVRALQTFIQS